MRPENSAFVPEDSSYPFRGVDFLSPETQIAPGLSPELKNVDVELGHLSKRRGYTSLGTGTIAGTPLALIEFPALSGTTFYVLVTTLREYHLSAGAWIDITFETTAPLTVERTGEEDDGIDWIIANGTDSTGTFKRWLIITNGIDKPRYWDGVTSKFREFSTAAVADNGAALSYPDFVTCKTFSTINGYLVMGNVTTTANEPDVVVWGDTVSLTEFLNFNSGAQKLVDTSGAIQKIMPLGDRLMVYSSDSIHHMIHVGGDFVFSFQKVLDGTRLLSQRAIVNVGPFHYFMSQENVYLFDGTRGLRRIGDAITKRYRERFVTSLKGRAFAFLDQPKNNVYFIVPTSETSSLVFKAEFDLFDVVNLKWVVHEYASRITTMGFFSNSVTLAWNSPEIDTLTWEQAGFLWNQGSVNEGFPRRVFGVPSGTNGAVVLSSDTTYNDVSAAVDASWESVDYSVPRSFLSENGRWIEVEFEARGTSVSISVSLDKGSSYSLITTKELTGAWVRYRVFFDRTGQTCRVKFHNNSVASGFEIRWSRIWVTPFGAY